MLAICIVQEELQVISELLQLLPVVYISWNANFTALSTKSYTF